MEDTFDEIIERAIQEAENVPCSITEFYRGLRSMKASIEQRMAIEAEEPTI